MVALADSMVGDHPARPCLVLSNNADAGGLAKAAARGIPTAVVDHRPFQGDRPAFEAELTSVLEDAGTELICLAGFMRILTDEFAAKWEGRMVNIHPSLLPAFKGLNVQQQALDAGVTISGCTVHYITPALDSGPIIAQAAVPVLPGDDADTLSARILKAEHQLYPEAVRMIVTGEVRLEGGRVVTAEGATPQRFLFQG